MIANEQDTFLALLMGAAAAMPQARAITTRTAAAAPHYYRCWTCCEVVTTAEPIPDPRNAVCDCRGESTGRNRGFEYLGQAKGGMLTRTEERCACDARCTNALGPNCDCICAGANHGTDRTVQVEILQSIPRVRLRDPAAAVARREELEREEAAVIERLRARLGPDVDAYLSGQWIASRRIWQDITDSLERARDAKRLKVHRNRIAALRKIS